MTENLRYGEKYNTIFLNTHYDFSREGGLATAVELCNGAGVCRKKNEGTMCPSYMVTMEDEHSTRGRANYMREILSGKVDPQEFSGKALHDALDLCLECKGCKAECPSNVDMAKLKYEFLAHYNEANGTPLRSQIFARIHSLSKMASVWPSLANSMMARPVGAKSIWIATSASMRVEVCRLSQLRPLKPGSGNRTRPKIAKPVGKVVLFHDTFVDFNYPEIGKATTTLLERGRLRSGACRSASAAGRPMISKGLPEAARANAAFNVARAEPVRRARLFDRRMRTELHPDVSRRVSRSSQRARGPGCCESFVSSRGVHRPRESRQDRWKLEFKRQRRKALIHGHCHEKALIGSRFLKEAVALAYSVEEIDSGCCGMAGSFGFEKEHYDVSMAIGRRRLFPAVERNRMRIVVAPGVSCRQQVEHATGKKALHPAEALVLALVSRDPCFGASSRIANAPTMHGTTTGGRFLSNGVWNTLAFIHRTIPRSRFESMRRAPCGQRCVLRLRAHLSVRFRWAHSDVSQLRRDSLPGEQYGLRTIL